jgi:hypothetical protein
MSPENRSTLYNYQPLDRLLIELYDPRELGNELDEIMSELVNHAGHEMNYNQSLVQRHYLLRMLRNIFWELKKNG